MKTLKYPVIQFSIVISDLALVKGIKSEATLHGGKIIEEYSDEIRHDKKHYLRIANAPQELFVKLTKNKSIVILDFISEIVKDKITLSIEFDDQKRIRYASVLIKINETRSNDLIRVYPVKEDLLSTKIKHYEINWGSVGAVSSDQAELFSKGFALAVKIAKECETKYCN